MAKIVIVGDVGGCVDQLVEVIGPMVQDPGTLVIQVGDLIDRGPDSSAVLAYVQQRLDAGLDGWVQLIGNHESQYLGGEPFWPQQLTSTDAELLRTWWMKERLRVAAAVRTADGEELLVTHAGVNVQAWQDLGQPVTASTAADLLNTRPDQLLWNDRGPLWAQAGTDVYHSWLHANQPVPFGQVHGHSTIVNYRTKTWLCDQRIRQRSTIDWTARHTYTRIGGHRFIGVDPKHGTTGAATWSPLILHDATLLS